MASDSGSTPSPVSGPGAVTRSSAAAVIARQDRIPIWSLSYLFIGIIGIGFLFTFFDIFDITVSFIQTCTQIVPGCNPANSSTYLGLPVELNLAGYVIGALILAPLADRFGRRDVLLFTLLLTGIGSLYTVFVGDYANFVIARTITGIGIGADLALVNAYINEVAPSAGRAKYTSLIFIMSSLGAFFGIWLGLWLTTPAAPFPGGLPFSIATVSVTASGPQFLGAGWRIMYAIGTLLAIVGVLLRTQLPESPRWLISRGRVDEADEIVTSMEARARRKVPELPAPAAEIPVQAGPSRVPYAEIFGNPLYLTRTILLVIVWFLGYVTVYAIAQGLTSLLDGMHYPPPESGMIAAFGTFGFIATAVFAYFFGEQLERKLWLPIAALLTLIGGILIGVAGPNNFTFAAIASIITFFGFNLWVPMTYSWSTENYPTRARATGFALVDGVGHLGGGVGILLIAPLIPTLIANQGLTTGPIVMFVIIAVFLIVAAIIAQFGTSTRRKRLDEVSP
ncbi:MAG TPA: MFS transporter [Ktedonobacteraceae bacterium]|nr:MFS transporter [Ktedonobacteraceae bacterium]